MADTKALFSPLFKSIPELLISIAVSAASRLGRLEQAEKEFLESQETFDQ